MTNPSDDNETQAPSKSFALRWQAFDDELVGARWWNESFEADQPATLLGLDAQSRRTLLKFAVFAGGGVALVAFANKGGCGDDDDVETSVESLQLQLREGWDVGARENFGLSLPGSRAQDVDAGDDWRSALNAPGLLGRLAPLDQRLIPFFVPTLFQSLLAPTSERLRNMIAPVHTPDMERAFRQAGALRDVFDKADRPGDVALIIDLPGEQAVAAAAALAPTFAPVFLFDNWPHPRGVVPSERALAGALYHLPDFERARAARPSAAPPAFVIDSRRLTAYRDDSDRFDNRYVAKLPSAQALAALGARRVLYVQASAGPELDDLNDSFVSFQDKGLPVRTIALDDFQQAPGAETAALASAAPYYYGGAPLYHGQFWSYYVWRSGQPAGSSAFGGRAAARNVTAPPRPPTISRGSEYVPVTRPTMFSGRTLGGTAGVGTQKPSGFGRVSVRTSRSTGAVRSFGGRSGSFGRSRSSYSG